MKRSSAVLATTWVSITLPPATPGGYRVIDFDGREGKALMNRNKTWHDAYEGRAQKPYRAWSHL